MLMNVTNNFHPFQSSSLRLQPINLFTGGDAGTNIFVHLGSVRFVSFQSRTAQFVLNIQRTCFLQDKNKRWMNAWMALLMYEYGWIAGDVEITATIFIKLII